MPEADGSGFVVISHCDRICRYSLNFANISGIVPISRKLFRPILQNISTIFQKFPECSRILLGLCQYQANYSAQYFKIYLQISRIFQNTSGIVPISGELFHPILPTPDSAKSNQHQFSLRRVSKCHRYGS